MSDRHASCLCVIPAKGGSTRLPRKNLAMLGPHPLLAYPISLALGSGLFDAVCVSTEDDEVAREAVRYGAQVPFMRPAHFARDPATIVDVLLHALTQYERRGTSFEQVAALLPTAPFTALEDVHEAMAIFRAREPGAVLSVTATDFPPFNALVLADDGLTLISAFPDSRYRATKSTECPATYRSNGAVVIARRDWLERNRTFYASDVLAWVMPPLRSIDIDTEIELEFARFLVASGRICPAAGVEVKIP